MRKSAALAKGRSFIVSVACVALAPAVQITQHQYCAAVCIDSVLTSQLHQHLLLASVEELGRQRLALDNHRGRLGHAVLISTSTRVVSTTIILRLALCRALPLLLGRRASGRGELAGENRAGRLRRLIGANRTLLTVLLRLLVALLLRVLRRRRVAALDGKVALARILLATVLQEQKSARLSRLLANIGD